jgi:hypothetical protein
MIFKKIIATLTLVMSIVFAPVMVAQSSAVPNIKSPNVAAMERFGQVPVNLFTGTPDISIPLHTLQSGNITVPIALRYHASSVKPAQHPGWVGLGWDIQSTGVITRKRNDAIDEVKCPGIYDSGIRPFRSYYIEPADNLISGSEKLEQAQNWTQIFNLENSILGLESSYFYDIKADEFNFNFLGHSGTFYFESPSKGWKVRSDENIKVEMNSFITPNQIYGILNSYKPFDDPILFIKKYGPSDLQTRFFGEFTLITEDGTRYTFGGTNAVEFHTPYYNIAGASDATLDSWLLKKIVDINGHVVDFNYTRDYRTCNLNYYFNQSTTSHAYSYGTFGANSSGQYAQSSSMTLNTFNMSGVTLFPTYLSTISSEKETITFTNNIATTLRYTQYEFEHGGGNADNQFLAQLNYNPNNLKWKKLTQIKVTDKIANKIVDNFTFDYFESTTQRFALKNLNFLGTLTTVGNNPKKYSFEYNNISQLPPYNGNYSDHWGFYNGKNINLVQNLYTGRQTDPLYTTRGLLNKMTYPTGGYTEFAWEAHQHGKKVTLKRNDLEPYTGYAGGSRISEIRSFSALGVLASKKSYYYVSNYSSGTSPNTLTSSGVLNGQPIYLFDYPNRTYVSGGLTYSFAYTLESIDSQTNYGFAGNGSHIGYDEVVEKNMDDSYTKHFFTNYGTDINGVSHFDILPAAFWGWDLNQDPYMPYSSLELERGKEIGTFDYNSINQLVRKNKITFRNDTERFDQHQKQVLNTVYIGGIAFSVGMSNFNYKYYPIKNETTTYDVNGNNPILASKSFNYNTKGQLIAEKLFTSYTGDINVITRYSYPNDIITEPNMASLIAANRIGTPIIKETFKASKKIFGEKTEYSPITSTPYNILPKTMYQAKFLNASSNFEAKMTYDQYDNRGNLTQYTTQDGMTTAIIWGYLKTMPIAKIENAKYSDVLSQVQNLQSLSDADNESGLITALNALRTSLPTALVTTYTHKNLIGVSTVTDPKGYTMFYTYDDFNRLQFVKDADGNLINENVYNYKK